MDFHRFPWDLHGISVDLHYVFDRCACISRDFPSQSGQDMSFEQYAKVFGKSYTDSERAKRKMAFEASKALVKEHNGKGFAWQLGLNEFSDYFPEELKAMRGLRTAGEGFRRLSRLLPSKAALMFNEFKGFST